MKYAALLFLSLFLTACHHSSRTATPVKPLIQNMASYYKTGKDRTIHFARTVKDSLGIHYLEGTISFDKVHNAVQHITKHETIPPQRVNTLLSDLKERNYKEGFDHYDKILFVQLHPEPDHELKILSRRQSIETKIHNELYRRNLGEWVAGDLGPGGANMLFRVKDEEKALNWIMHLLQNEGILHHSLIARRLFFSPHEWNYEILYPIDFSGTFNQM